MKKYTPFAVHGSNYDVCSECDSGNNIAETIRKQEERKVREIVGYVCKSIYFVICEGHRTEKGNENKFIRPMGVDVDKPHVPMTKEEYETILEVFSGRYTSKVNK